MDLSWILYGVDGFGGLLGSGASPLLQRAEDRFPGCTAMLAREPSIDAGREVVLIAAPEGLVLLGEDDTTTAPWDRVTGIRRSGEVVIVTVRADDDADEREFAFERVASERSLLAWKNASAGSFVTAAERVRDA